MPYYRAVRSLRPLACCCDAGPPVHTMWMPRSRSCYDMSAATMQWSLRGCAGVSGGLLEDGDGEGARAADLAAGPGDGRGVGLLEVRVAGHPLLQGDPEFHPGQVGPEAAMPPQPERGMAVPGPVQLHHVGILEDARIPVGGREREQQ